MIELFFGSVIRTFKPRAVTGGPVEPVTVRTALELVAVPLPAAPVTTTE
jgi:hypothetical protein